MASSSRKTKAEQADANTEGAQDGTSVDTESGEVTVGLTQPNGDLKDGRLGADGFTTEANAPLQTEEPKDEPVNELGQTVEQAREEAERASDPKRAAVNLSAPLDAPVSQKVKETGVVEIDNEGISVPAGLATSPGAASPVITNGARLLDEDGNEVTDPEGIFDIAQGPQQFATVNKRVYVEEGVPGSKRTTKRLLFPAGARVHRATVGTFVAEWADKAAK